jgi:hypothetical protein
VRVLESKTARFYIWVNMSTLVIAEAGVNHGGDLKTAESIRILPAEIGSIFPEVPAVRDASVPVMLSDFEAHPLFSAANC